LEEVALVDGEMVHGLAKEVKMNRVERDCHYGRWLCFAGRGGGTFWNIVERGGFVLLNLRWGETRGGRGEIEKL
jgi:hypothetical protein